ncbi:MAG TPA: taurine ABC transporter substrate-binding protein, partial [Lachnospiraceae bacterium]|nr:taurine ABC transporter substrate-binding protein [Lachnospiraceae bacterium]
MKKRLLSLLFAAVMLAGLLAGCGKNGEETSADPTKAPVEEGKKEEKKE